jgi:hypothetical protein
MRVISLCLRQQVLTGLPLTVSLRACTCDFLPNEIRPHHQATGARSKLLYAARQPQRFAELAPPPADMGCLDQGSRRWASEGGQWQSGIPFVSRHHLGVEERWGCKVAAEPS